jgi:diguanylate cyclase (GGDEF)-like protein
MEADERTMSLPRQVLNLNPRNTRPARKDQPTLRVVAGRDMLRFMTLQPGQDGIIGRDAGSAVVLSDASVSRKHARVVRGDDGVISVHDLGSTNGTAVNGQPIERSILRPNDHLEVGAVALRLDLLSEEEVEHHRNVLRRLESANHDPLTGLYTRAWLEEPLPSVVERCDEAGARITAVFLDLDQFKSINDRFGHPVGDDVLVAVARMIMLDVRDGDACVRYGGEEIAMFLIGTREDGGTEVAERLRRAMLGHDWSRTAPGLRVTGSFGVAERRERESIRDWLSRADQACYQAKRKGRNQVVRAG